MTQKQTVLLLLQTRGFKGVSANELIYDKGITRGAAIVHELRKAGHDIETVGDGQEHTARYVMRSGAILDCSCGHNQRQHAFGPCRSCECEEYRAA